MGVLLGTTVVKFMTVHGMVCRQVQTEYQSFTFVFLYQQGRPCNTVSLLVELRN